MRIAIWPSLLLVPFVTLAKADMVARAPQATQSGISPIQCVLQDPLEPVQCCQEVGTVSHLDKYKHRPITDHDLQARTSRRHR